MNPNLQIFLNKKTPYHRIPTNLDRLYEEDWKEYYSPSDFPSLSSLFRSKNRSFLLLIGAIFLVFLLLLIMFRGNEEGKIYTKMEETTSSEAIKIEAQTLGVAKEDVRGSLENYLNSIDPHEQYPDDVNSVKPHHIRVIGAMGDSLTIGSRASNVIKDEKQRYPGNAFFTGMDTEVDGHLTVYNIFRVIAEETDSKLFGGSTGEDYGENTGLNVAVGGRKSDDILRQAEDLVARIKANSEIDIKKDWKLVSLWIGTNDVGDLGYGFEPPIPAETESPRTIVSIIGMFPAQLLQEAQSILKTGLGIATQQQKEFPFQKRAKDVENQKKLDALSNGYRQASFEIQNEGKFNTREFTVVVQPFATQYDSVYVDRIGNYNSSFYAIDLFHLSKLGHAILAKHYWQNLFESVGEKTTKAELGDISPRIFELNTENSFIKTIGNSKV
ncbi:unnamed protein product [Caenorhabditis sp. 36 PRJEB53466]|nr:unnamed protein product [Caenorhabditis sp. 36 PRJEB53466]